MKMIIKSFIYSWKMIWEVNHFSMIVYIGLQMLITSILLLQTYIFGLLLNNIILGDIAKITSSAFTYFILLILFFILSSTNRYLKKRIDANSSKHFNDIIANKLNSLPLSFIDSSEGRDLSDYADRCEVFVCDEIPFGIFTIIKEIYAFVISIVVLLQLNVWFVILYLLLTIPGIILNYVFDRKAEKFRQEYSADRRKMLYYRWMLVDATPAKDIRMYNLTDDIKQRYNDEYSKYYTQKKQLDKKLLVFSFLTELLRRSGEITMFVYIIYHALIGSISIGDIAMYTGYVITSANSFYHAVSQFIGYVFYACRFIMPEYFKFLSIACPDDVSSEIRLSSFETLEFKNVYFKYPLSTEYILKGVSFQINQGDKISLIGINGSGKTTIVKLMLRLYEVDAGEILINGINITRYDIKDIRRIFSVLFQNFVKYPLSLRDNIALSDYQRVYNDEEITQSLKQSGIYDELSDNLNNHLDTKMTRRFSDDGIELSGGQWQKIALSRAYFKNSEILIFDEPSASLDAEAEDRIFNNFAKISNGKTGIMISHRVSSARMASQIIVLDEGKIIENGTHEELIENNGVYAKLFNLQKNKYLAK
ncbi:MAG: ABC transporter ATP-binding protein [Clostridiales bacterium]|nr:ABC transporter ATP-binding protein [Clostridiales bacterium]